jgi:hypothetical protein
VIVVEVYPVWDLVSGGAWRVTGWASSVPRTGHGSALIACLGKSCNVQFVVRKSDGMPEAVNQ